MLIRPRFRPPTEQTVEDMCLYGHYMVERVLEQAKANGQEQMVVIYDKLGYDKPQPYLKKFVKIHTKELTDYYPERLGVMFFLNTNWIFRLMMAVVRPFLTQRTRDKIQVVTDLKTLKEYFDDDCLLPEHGGTSTENNDPYKEYNIPLDE